MIPSYNHAPFIERTLRSIFRQTLPPKKLIVIDDGSKDESVKIIEKMLKDAPFEAELIARENRGLCATLNQGLGLSTTEYFCYISSDDLWLPGFLESRAKILEDRKKAILAFGHAYLMDEDDQIIDCTKDWGDYTDGSILLLLLKMVTPASASFLYRREALEKHSWNENSILEDYELYLKLSDDGEFAFDPAILCGWRQHGWNVSKDYPRMLQEVLEAQNRVAPEIGISPEELEKYQATIKFNAAHDFIRRGDRGMALSLMWENRKGAESISQIAKILLRMSVPKRLFEKNRIRMRQKNIKKYGKMKT